MEPSTTPPPTPAAPATPAPAATPEPQAPATPEPTDPPEGKGGKEQVLADLAKERDKRQALEQRLADAEAATKTQLDNIAKALGLKQDDPSDASAIAKQLEESQRQAADNAAALTRFQVAVEKSVPPNLVEFVTGSTREEVEASVTKVLAAFAAAPAQPTGPRPDPSQGQQGNPASLDARIAQAHAAGNTREAIRLKAQQGLNPTN